MGIAAGTASHAAKLFEKMGPIMQAVPAEYHGNYRNKSEASKKQAAVAIDKAQNVFFEKIPDHSNIKIPDQKNFVKFDDSANAELLKIPFMNETLRHVVPPEVRSMQGEFKTQMQNMIDQAYKAQEKADTEERSFLGQYQLPQSFYELTSSQGLPEQYLKRILEFQKKGSINNFTNIISGIEGVRVNAEGMISEIEQLLNEEEQLDASLRSQHGPKWTTLPSNGMTGPYRQNVNVYRQKIQQAQAQDEMSFKRFNDQRSELEILAKTPQEIEAMMPQSESGSEAAQRPCSINLKQALDNIEAAKVRKEEIIKEVVDKLANLNLIEELMEVHLKTKSKEQVFTAKKDEFKAEFDKINEQDQLILASNKVIQTNIGDFQKLKQSIAIDPTRQQFFQRIDLALMCQSDLENMLSQGTEFYQRLIEHLSLLKQNVADFKNARTIQATDLCK